MRLLIALDPATISQIAREVAAQLQPQLTKLTQQETTIMADLSALQAEVAKNTTIEQSAITLIQGLAAQIQAAGTDPAKLQAIVDQLTANDAALAAAVTANTTPAPTTPTA